MADENNNPNPDAATAAQGASKENLSEGQSGTSGAPGLPEINNKPPVKELTAEEKAAKEAADKVESEKKTAEEEAAKKKEAEANEFPVYDDTAADAVTAMLKESGVTLKEADSFFAKAVETMDLNDVDVEGLTKKVGKEKADLIMIGVKDYYTRNMAETMGTVKAIHDSVGGKENYDKVAEWARNKANTDKAFAGELEQFNKMLDLNRKSAVAAITELKALYEKDPNNKTLQVKIVQGDSSATNLGGETLTRKEYLAKVKAAEEEGNYAEANRLRAIRLNSKKNGVR